MKINPFLSLPLTKNPKIVIARRKRLGYCDFHEKVLSLALEGVGAPKASDFAAHPAPEWLLKTVICQVPLRSFTQEGTLAAAAERLGHLADAGIGCVYLLPIVESDPDQNREFWSPR